MRRKKLTAIGSGLMRKGRGGRRETGAERKFQQNRLSEKFCDGVRKENKRFGKKGRTDGRRRRVHYLDIAGVYEKKTREELGFAGENLPDHYARGSRINCGTEKQGRE